MQENKVNNPISFQHFLERISITSETQSVAWYAERNLLEAMRREGVLSLSESFLKSWIADMLLHGTKPSTCKRYVGRAHAVWLEWPGHDEQDPFAPLVGLDYKRYATDAEAATYNLSLLPRLLVKNDTAPEYQTVALFLYLLYAAGSTLDEAISLKFVEAPNWCPQITDIIETRDSANGRKYVFALKQGKTTPAQIRREVLASLGALAKAVGMRVGTAFTRETVTAIWVNAALKEGVDVRDIRAIIPAVPACYPALMLAPSSTLSDTQREDIICRVANRLNNNSSNWFAMRLRSGVSIDDVKSRIQAEMPGHYKAITFFSPSHTVTRREGKRIIREEVAYIPGLVFFKTGRNRVRPLFARIGDIAWCYRMSAMPDSPYAIISHRDMSRFQKYVGNFTDDVRMELLTYDASLTPGRKVRVTGGIMEGYEGEIIDVAGQPGMRIFSLRITDTASASWMVHVEDYYIEPINEANSENVVSGDVVPRRRVS